MASRIQLRRDTVANWTSANPTLSAGEAGYETDTGLFKIGDGATVWTALEYQGGGTPTAASLAAAIGTMTDAQATESRAGMGAAMQSMALFSAPRFTSKLANLGNRNTRSQDYDQLGVMAMGDSLGGAIGHNLMRILSSRIGLAGLALRGLVQTTSGDVTVAADGPDAINFNRPDIWGDGRVVTMRPGGEVIIKQSNPPTAPISFSRANAASFYFAKTATGGTVDLYYSRDDGSTWTTLATGVSTTDAGGVAPLVLPYTFTLYRVQLKAVCRTGEVEFIGAALRNSNATGLMYAESWKNSLTMTQWNTGNAAIRAAVFADLGIDCTLVQMSEVQSIMDSDHSAFIDGLVAAEADMDIVWVQQHPWTVDSTIETANLTARAKAETTPQMVCWEANEYFGGFDGIDGLGWNSGDTVHLTLADEDDKAWNFQAGLLASRLCLEAESGSMTFPLVEQSSGTAETYQFEKKNAAVTQSFKVDDDRAFTKQVYREDATTYATNLWQEIWHPNSLSSNPNGYEELLSIAGAVYRPMIVNFQGKRIFQRAASTQHSFTGQFSGGVVMAYETSASYAAFRGINTAAVGVVFSMSDGTTENGALYASGRIKIVVPSYADDAAADADTGLLSGQLYKTTAGGRAVFQKP